MHFLKKYFSTSQPLLDSVFILFLIGFALFHIFFYLNVNYLNTLYPDWMVHAFRIKFLQDFGFISWTHIWANGINLWRAYQFIPHYLTIGLINTLHLSITRAMVVMTILLFVLIRLFIYIPLRALGFSPMVALICTLLSFNIAQYWAGVADYSLLFGFTAFPLVLALWILYLKGKMQNMYPFITGLLFYIHPLLGFLACAFWVMSLFQSKNSFFSVEHTKQFAIILISSSLFWLPILYKPSFVYTSSDIASKYFLNLLLSSYDYYGLSIAILVAMLAGTLQLFLPISKKQVWVKPLAILTIAYFLLIIIGTTIDLPRVISQFQFTRGAAFIGLSSIFIVAPVLQWLLQKRITIINLVLSFFIILMVTDGIWFSSVYSPGIKSSFDEPITAYVKSHPESDLLTSHIWVPDISLSSYFPSDTLHMPYSYMTHMDTNQISPRINQLINYQAYVGNIPQENVDRINDYFKISGIQYAFFEESSPYTKTLSESASPKYKNLGRVNFKQSIYHLFAMPWQPVNAAIIEPNLVPQLTPFPSNLVLENPTDQIQLDNKIVGFTNAIYSSGNSVLSISYPTQDSLEIQVPDNRISNDIYIAESYDSEWHATLNADTVQLQPVGPNYMLAVLPNKSLSGRLLLKHTWPLTFYLSWGMIISMPVTILLANIIKFLLSKMHAKKRSDVLSGAAWTTFQEKHI